MKFFLVAFVALSFHIGYADAKVESLQAIQTQISKHKVIQGDFKQLRTVKDMDLKLSSEGDFKFSLPMDLHWQQKKPFVLDLLMAVDKMVQKNADGSQQVITKDQQPVLFSFSSIFIAVLAGDQKAIDKNFAYNVESNNKKWKMSLIPKDELYKKAISEIKISGAEFVEKVEVTEKSGNSTVIQFLNIKGS